MWSSIRRFWFCTHTSGLFIAYAVNHPRNTGGDLEHPVNGGVGEDILPAAGIPQMRLYVSFTVCPVQQEQQLYIPILCRIAAYR